MDPKTQSQLGSESLPNVPHQGDFNHDPGNSAGQPGPQGFLSLAQASQITGYHQDYLGQLARSGKLKSQKLGRNWVTTQAALDELLAQPNTLPFLEKKAAVFTKPVEAPTPPTLQSTPHPELQIIVERLAQLTDKLEHPVKPATARKLFSGLTSRHLAHAALAMVLFFPVIASLTDLQSKVGYMKGKAYDLVIMTQDRANQKATAWLKNKLAELGIGQVTVSRIEIVERFSRNPELSSGSQTRDPETQPSSVDSGGQASSELHSGQVLGTTITNISNEDFLSSLRAVLATGLPEDIKVALQGPPGPQGVPGTIAAYIPNSGSVFGTTLASAPNPGTIGSMTYGSSKEFSTQLLTVTSNATINGPLVLTGDLSLTGTATFTGDLLPGTDNLYTLGSTTKRWSALHAGPAGLIVHNDATDTSKVSLVFSGSNAILASDAATPLQLTTGANNGINILANGKVGIGTTNPQSALHITGTDALIIPVGTTAQRPADIQGAIRYNTTTSTFEGYSGSVWSGLGGVIDVDQDTYILAESAPGADEDILYFYTNGTKKAEISPAGGVNLYGTDPILDLTTASTLNINTTTNRPVTFGTGLVTIPNLAVTNSQTGAGTFSITSNATTETIFSVTGTGLTSGTAIGKTVTANAGNGQVTKGEVITLTDATTAGGGFTGIGITVTGAGTGSGSKYLLSLNPNTANNEVVFDNLGAFRPTTAVASNTATIGSPSFYWKNGYFDQITANNLSGTVISGATSSTTWTIGSEEAGDVNEAIIFQRNSGSGNALIQWNGGVSDLRYLSANYPFNATYTVSDASIGTGINLFSGNLTNNTTAGTQKLLSLTNTGTGTTENGIYINNTGTGTTAFEIAGTWTNGIITNDNSINAGTAAVSGGAGTFTTLNGNTITTGTGTLTLGAGKTLTVSDSTTLATNAITLGGGEVITFSATNALSLLTTGSTSVTLPTSGTLYGTATDSITSLQLLTSISDETGTGSLVFATTPTLVTPVLGVATATSIAIGANTVDTTEWANLDGLNQTVATTSSPTFANITDSGLTITRIPYASTAGLLVDSANLTYSGTRLSPNYVTLAAGTATAGTAPLKLTSGALLTAPEAGAIEFLTDAYYATITTGAARKTFAFLESPAFTTPNIGVATATSINGLTITSSTGTLTITNLKTLSVSNTLTFTGTDASSVAFGAGGTVAYTADKLSAFAATTSAELDGVISDDTGSGALVFADTPTLVTPVLGVATATSIAIGANTVDTNEWANLDGLNQTLATTSTPQFARVGIGAAADATNILTATSGSTTDLSKALNVSHTGAITGTGYAGYFSKTGVSTTNVGLYATASGATNNYAAIFEAGNVGIGTTTASSLLTLGSTGVLGWDNGSGVTDTLLRRDAANTLSMRNGSNDQTVYVYANYIDASNYGRLRILLTAGHDAYISTQGAGSVSAGSLNIAGGSLMTLGLSGGDGMWEINSTSLNPSTDNGRDLGTSAKRARSGYFGTSVIDPLLIGGTAVDSSLSLKSTSGVGTTDYIKFLVGNNGATEAMRIINSGNVGIGTTAPSSKLDITTTALGTTQTTTSGLALVNTTAAAAGAQQISPAIRWSGFGWKTDATAASQAVDFRAYVTPVEGTANPTGYLGFGSSINGGAYNDNQLVLTSAGNVGIGTTNPGVKLEAVGAAASPLTILKIANSTNDTGVATGANLDFGYQTSVRQELGRIGVLEAGNNSGQGYLVFSAPNGGAVTEIMRMGFADGGTSGNVGIGTTNPVDALTVSGRSRTLGTAPDWMSYETDAAADNRLWSLQVQGEQFIGRAVNDAEGVANAWLVVNRTGATIDDVNFVGTGGSPAYRMTIQNGGNVGIGTTNPSEKLHVYGASGSIKGIIQSAGTTSSDEARFDLVRGGTSAYANVVYKTGSSIDWAVGTRTGDDGGLYFNDEGSTGGTGNRMYIKNDGNVGIGTTGPQAIYGTNLTISKTAANGDNGGLVLQGLATSDNTIGGIDFMNGSSRQVAIQAYRNGGDTTAGLSIYVSNAGTENVRALDILGNGNVGIGDTAPDVHLGIKGDGDAIQIERASGTDVLDIGTGSYLGLSDADAAIYATGNLLMGANGGAVLPLSDNNNSFGNGSFRWTAIYAVNGTIQTSDEREKHNITETPLGLDFINKLRAVEFEYNDISGVRQGFIAQEVLSALDGHPFVGGLTYDAATDRYGLNYSAFVSPLTKAVQELDGKSAGFYVGSNITVGDIITFNNNDNNNVTKASSNDRTVGVALSVNSQSSTVRVGFIGQTQVKVSEEKGQIHAGDRLTLSETNPGYAVKMAESGQSIGTALEDSSGGTEGLDLILVFVSIGYQHVDIAQNADGQLVMVDNDTDYNGHSLLNVKSIASLSGKWSIAEDGTLTVAQLCLEDVCINKTQLQTLLQNAGLGTNANDANQDANTSNGDTGTVSPDASVGTVSGETISNPDPESSSGDSGFQTGDSETSSELPQDASTITETTTPDTTDTTTTADTSTAPAETSTTTDTTMTPSPESTPEPTPEPNPAP